MALPSYVKFQRGSLASYNRLSRKDADTLYFIYDENDESKGRLYLGTRLIGNIGGTSGITNLSELADVIATEAQTGDFLVLNSEGKWTAVAAADVAQTIINAGGNFVSIDNKEFQFNSVNGALELKGYNQAVTGMVPVKGDTGIFWQTVPSIDLGAKVDSLEDSLEVVQSDVENLKTNFQTIDNKIATAINSANHLKYEIVSDLSEALDENTIYLHANNSAVNNNAYDEYMLIGNKLEIIGSTGVDLSNYVAKTDNDFISLQTTVSNLNQALDNYVLTTTFNTVVGDLSSVNGQLNDLSSNDSISDTLTDIYQRLTWQEIRN